MRRATALLLLGLAGCGSEVEATADPAATVRALALVQDSASIALAGEAELFTRVRGPVLEVRRVAPPEVLYRFEAPEGAEPSAQLSASAERTALVVETEDDTSYMASVQELIDFEPVTPPFKPTREGFFPVRHQIEGTRVITDEFRGDFGAVRWAVREPGAEPRRAAVPEKAVGAVFAGDLAAYAVPFAREGYDAPQRLIVRDWRTGEVRLDRRVRGGVEALDLRPDGRVVLNEDGGGLLSVSASGAVTRLTRGGVFPQWAGERIVFLRQGELEGDERLMVVEPDGRVRRFGVPTAQVRGFVVDGERVLWKANGCLLTGPVSAAPAPEAGPGPCPRSELFLDDRGRETLRRDRRVPLTLRCVAAAAPGCRGTVRVELADGSPRGRDSAAVRFRIAAGRSGRLAPRLTRRAYRAALREAREGIGGLALGVYAVAVDPDGRRSRLSDGYSLEVARR